MEYFKSMKQTLAFENQKQNRLHLLNCLVVNSMTSNLRIFAVEFNYCGQQFPGKSLSTGQYIANKEGN